MKAVLKEGTVFQLELPSHLKSRSSNMEKPIAVNIWGDKILYKGSERSKIKFKEKYQLELY